MGANSVSMRSPRAVVRAIGAFEKTRSARGATIVTVHGVFQRGSSKLGTTVRAKCDSSWLYRYQRPPSRWRNRPIRSVVASAPAKSRWSVAGPGASARPNRNPTTSVVRASSATSGCAAPPTE